MASTSQCWIGSAPISVLYCLLSGVLLGFGALTVVISAVHLCVRWDCYEIDPIYTILLCRRLTAVHIWLTSTTVSQLKQRPMVKGAESIGNSLRLNSCCLRITDGVVNSVAYWPSECLRDIDIAIELIMRYGQIYTWRVTDSSPMLPSAVGLCRLKLPKQPWSALSFQVQCIQVKMGVRREVEGGHFPPGFWEYFTKSTYHLRF